MTVALWCVVAAGLLPYVAAGIAKGGKSGFDNSNPRPWLAQQTGYRARANAAQQNGFEAFPFFATAVLVAHLLRGPQGLVDQLAVLFIVARVAYLLIYLAGNGTLRSLAWLVGMLAVLGIFGAAAM
jgi:uncharacterized MAPEG superfamily protein